MSQQQDPLQEGSQVSMTNQSPITSYQVVESQFKDIPTIYLPSEPFEPQQGPSTCQTMDQRYEIVMQHNRDLARMFESASMELQKSKREFTKLWEDLDRSEHELARARSNFNQAMQEVQDLTRELNFKKKRIQDLDEDLKDFQDRVRAQNSRARMVGSKLQELREVLGNNSQVVGAKIQEILDMLPNYD